MFLVYILPEKIPNKPPQYLQRSKDRSSELRVLTVSCLTENERDGPAEPQYQILNDGGVIIRFAGVDDLLPQELVFPGSGGEEAPVHLDVPDVCVAGGDEARENVAVEEGRPLVFSGVGGVKGAKGYYQEGGAVLPSVNKVRECFLGVSISPNTLSEPEPCRETGNYCNQPPAGVTAEPEFPCPIPAVVQGIPGQVEAHQELEVLQRLTERVELVRKPEVSEANVKEWSENYS